MTTTFDIRFTNDKRSCVPLRELSRVYIGCRTVRLACLVLLSACSARATTAERPREAIDARAAWSTLQRSLPGRWIATTEGASVPVEFCEIAGGSVVLEMFGRAGHQTATTYHADGAGLVATHYCAQGNQPRLRARHGDAHHVVLVMSDATGVEPGEAVMVELSYDFDADGFTRWEVYRQPDGTLERTTWRYTHAQ
jgi:hypothetical protein